MNQNILLSKIVANATEISWAQAYATLNLYIVLSIETKTEETSIASLGKEILEKLQREFFAQDEKNLLTIKKAVENAVESIDKDIKLSLVLTTLVDSIFYIVIASSGMVILKRGEVIGSVAEGEEGNVVGFSGHLQRDDVVILETNDFSKKVPLASLTPLLKTEDIMEIAENLAPLIHEGSRGTEAAIIIQNKQSFSPNKNLGYRQEPSLSSLRSESKQSFLSDKQSFLSDKSSLDPDESKGKEQIEKEELRAPERPKNFLAYFSSRIRLSSLTTLLPHYRFSGKKMVLFFGILFLLLILGISLVLEKRRGEQKKQEQLLESIISPARKKYDEAISLVSLNKSLALENLSSTRETLLREKDMFPRDSTARKKIDGLDRLIDEKIQELEKSAIVKNQKLLLDASQDRREIQAITVKGDEASVLDRSAGTVFLLKDDGLTASILKSEAKNALFLAADKTYVYVVGDSRVFRIDKKSQKSEKIISLSSASDIGGIDTFLGNVYLLNKKSKDIEKYTASEFQKTSYLRGATLTFPISMTIDSSIWIAEENGKIRKFTKGVEDEFSLKGLARPLGKNVSLYTDSNASNLYILDPEHKRVVVVGKNGEYQTQYEWEKLKDATSFSVDEKGKKVFVVIDNKLYTFDI